jgi:anti-anti-sigma factor
MRFQTSFQEIGDVTVIRCSGRIVAGPEVESFQLALAERIKLCKRFVINMNEVSFLDSSGLGILVRFCGTAKSVHGGVKLCNVGAMQARVLKLTKLDKVLEMYACEADALSAFGQLTKSEVGTRDGIRVVCVDGSLNVLAYLRELLSQHGYSAMTTANAYDARNILKAVRPALVILGPGIPGADNENFQSALKGIPVLALGTEFHTGEAAVEAENLIGRIKTAIEQASKAATP